MDEREMFRLWRARSAAAGGSERDDEEEEKEVLMQVQKESAKLRRALLWRDAREVAAGLLVVVATGYASWQAPGRLPKLGAAAVLIAVVYTCFRLLATRRTGAAAARSAAAFPLAERLRREIAAVEGQIDLLRSVASWYVLPLAAGGAAWLVTLVPAMPLPAWARAVAVAAVLAFCALLFWGVGKAVVALNRRAAEDDLVPYRDELVSLLREVEAEAG